jgi:spermidine synthase
VSMHLDERADGGFALYIDGDLQFDTRDEAVYHESLALPALCLASTARVDYHAGMRVLICGGGDGLALRECLSFPGVEVVDLVDYDPQIVEMARTRFAELNGRAFDDPRVSVHMMDAWEFLARPADYDVVVCDFTVPRTQEDTRVFTREWYGRVKSVLAPDGVAAFNAVSPQTTAEALWCLRRTVRAAGLWPLPYRVCIPSFREQGYGAWAFMLAAHRPLRQEDLRCLDCPVETRQADISKLWRGARFNRRERERGRTAPVHTLEQGCLLELLLNPGQGIAAHHRQPAAELTDSSPYDLGPLLAAIPVTHPYHTRAMVETLAEQVIGAVRALDVRTLVEALLRRAARLPRDMVQELKRLREFLRERAERLDLARPWVYRLFAALVITMTLANAIAPDNAFAKGSSGLGHASMSRGYSGGFGGGRGGFPSARVSTAGTGGSHVSAARVTGRGFRSGYGRGRMVDIYGNSYGSRIYVYCGGGGGHIHPHYVVGGGRRSAAAPPPERRQAIFAADDDMMVLDNGDVVITLSDRAYLLVVNGTLSLMSTEIPDPLIPLYPDPNLFKAIAEQIADQKVSAEQAVSERRDWLSWVGWTSALFSTVADDKLEARHLEDLDRRLTAASGQVGKPFEGAVPVVAPANYVELFVGCFLTEDGRIRIRGRDTWYTTDGKRLWREEKEVNKEVGPAPAELTAVLKSVLEKLRKELAADIASHTNDLTLIANDRSQIERDLAEYQSIFAQNGYDPYYEVDYGTDSIGVSDAISRTQNDLAENQRDHDETVADHAKSTADVARIDAALLSFGR